MTARRWFLLQARLASYLGHLRRAACQRLLATIWAEHPWLTTYLLLDRRTLTLRRRDQPPTQARTVLAQYRHWQQAYPDDLVLIQVGAFFEQLQWPLRQKAKGSGVAMAQDHFGLQRMQPTRRGRAGWWGKQRQKYFHLNSIQHR